MISGEDGCASEDMAAALYIDALIDNTNVDPTPFVEAANQSKAANEIRKGLSLVYTGVDFKDISICLDVDKFDFCLIASPSSSGVEVSSFLPTAANYRF